MKKLALALLCMVSVAFFASCDPQIDNPEPSIAVIADEGFAQDGDTIDFIGDNVQVVFGFNVAANNETKKNLTSLVVTIDDTEWANKDLTGQSGFYYVDTVVYTMDRDIVGSSVITAVVTDEAGNTNTATITLTFNEAAQPLLGTTIEWVRKGANLLGNTEAEMASYGLQWTGSYKEVFATIKPIEGAIMYVCNGDDFATITNTAEKAAYFANLAETGTSVDKYRNITTNNSANYNDMLAIVNGENTSLVLISRAEIETGSYGTQITIKGATK